MKEKFEEHKFILPEQQGRRLSLKRTSLLCQSINDEEKVVQHSSLLCWNINDQENNLNTLAYMIMQEYQWWRKGIKHSSFLC